MSIYPGVPDRDLWAVKEYASWGINQFGLKNFLCYVISWLLILIYNRFINLWALFLFYLGGVNFRLITNEPFKIGFLTSCQALCCRCLSYSSRPLSDSFYNNSPIFMSKGQNASREIWIFLFKLSLIPKFLHLNPSIYLTYVKSSYTGIEFKIF